MSRSPGRNSRADAQRSRAAILDAAVQVLDAEPAAGMADIAAAAGVTRQTVYAHFPGRDQLLAAVLDHLTEQVVAEMDAAEPGTGPAADALARVLDAAQRASGRHPALLQKLSSLPVSQDGDHRRHLPVADRLKRVIERGQGTGEFDDRLSTDWLVAVTISLAHTASAETDAGRISGDQAREALHTSLFRVLGAGT